MARQSVSYTVLDAATATGVGKFIFCRDFRNAIVTIAGADTSVFTVKCKGSIGDTAAAFASTQSPSNAWETIQVIDLEDGNPVNGNTGVGFVANDVRIFEVNINSLDWLTFDVTAYTSGNCTIKVVLTDNQ